MPNYLSCFLNTLTALGAVCCAVIYLRETLRQRSAGAVRIRRDR